MKRISNARLGLAVCALAIGLGACGPSQDQLIQTAIAKTQAAATSTPAPTPTLSPERLYVQEVTPVLAALDSLSNTSGEFSTFINTNAADLMFCEGMARSSGPWLCPLTNAASAEALVLTQRITDSGFEVKSLIEAITPPASLRTSHTQIRACID